MARDWSDSLAYLRQVHLVGAFQDVFLVKVKIEFLQKFGLFYKIDSGLIEFRIECYKFMVTIRIHHV